MIGRIGILSAVIPPITLLASAFYDWGFLFSIGISFAEAPTTIADHFRSWLVWLPEVTLSIFIILLLEMSTRRIEKGMTEKEIVESTPNPEKTKKMREKPFRLIPYIAILGIIVWLFFGGHIAPVIFLSIILWFVISNWILSHPVINQRHSMWFKYVFYWGPPTLALFFYVGSLSAQYTLSDSGTSHKLHIKNAVADIQPMTATIIRYFEKYLLVRNQDGTIMWIQTDNVHTIEQITEAPFFEGVICYYRQSWCPWSQPAKSVE